MKKSLFILLISCFFVSCLTTPPRPRFLSYNLMKKNSTTTSPLSVIEPNFSTIYSGNRYRRSVLHFKLLTLNNTRINFNDITLNSKLFTSDSVEINIIPNDNTVYPNIPITVSKNDTLNFLVYFFNKKRRKTLNTKAYLNLKKTDTVNIKLDINNEIYSLFFQ